MVNYVNLDNILPLVRKPGQYVGGEMHAVSGQLDNDSLKFCLIFPDLYEIGMSHQGLQILYHILNQQDKVVAHRCYAPDADMERALRSRGLPLFSLEAKADLASYDVLGVTLPYELCYTNILTILDLAGLPLRAADRDERYPLVIGGGSCALNPEPVADFFDAIVLGDGEEVIVEVVDILRQAAEEQQNRGEVLERLARVRGVYVPAFFTPVYEGGQLVAVTPAQSGSPRVERRILSKMHAEPYLMKPLVPVVKPVHDRLAVEIARGCTRGCRFCQAGIIYRPVRERSIEEIMNLATGGIGSSGFEEIALLSLSTGDFSCLGELMTALMDRFADNFVSVSMPSMRVGTLTPEIMQQIKRVRKTGFTVAPEAGTDRLRGIINKGITEEDLLATCRDAFALGWNLIKFYFMVGLPTETMEDVEAIIDLCHKARRQAGQGRARMAQVNLGVATFVPKPHTPFQWEPQLSLEESKNRIKRLRQLIPRKGFKIKWHDPEQSFVEGVFSRGDRRLADLIEQAWRNGVRFDSWSEHFRLESWRQAAVECGIDLEQYLRRRSMEETLPWDHLHTGVSRSFLKEEHAKALEEQYTPDCRVNGCQQCGVCDFDTIKPVTHSSTHEAGEPAPQKPREERRGGQQPVFSYRVRYTRCGDSRFYGHLEMLQLIFRTLNRTGLPVMFSQGFHPTPRVAFSQALPVGVESHAEYFDVDLFEPLSSPDGVTDLLNIQLPREIRVVSVSLVPRGTPGGSLTGYTIRSEAFPAMEMEGKISDFLGKEEVIIERYRKNRHTVFDLRPLVSDMAYRDDVLCLELLGYQGKPGANPREILEKVFGCSEEEALLARIVKTSVREVDVPS